jgi:hypothetical protein
MRFKLFVSPLLTLCLITAAVPSFSQVAPSYQSKGLPISLGIGPSSYDVDWGHGRMYGGTAWLDWYPTQMPSVLHGLGLEIEVRDISLDRHLQPGSTNPKRSGQANMRQDTAGGGPIYTWRKYRNFHPYGKYIIGDGSIDFVSSSIFYSHDTRIFQAPGGGFEAHMFGPLWARADYEYQFWPGLFGNTLNPQGFTVGVSYDFSHTRQR